MKTEKDKSIGIVNNNINTTSKSVRDKNLETLAAVHTHTHTRCIVF